MITPRGIKDRVTQIASLVRRKEFERAHSEEDKLHLEVMQHVATRRDLTADEGRALLSMALVSRSIQYERVCG